MSLSELRKTPKDGSLACCRPCSHKESDAAAPLSSRSFFSLPFGHWGPWSFFSLLLGGFVLFFWEELERGRVCLWACLLGRRSRTFCPLPSLARASSPDLLSGTTSFSSHPQLDTDDQRCVIPFILGIISYPRKYSHHASRNYRSKIIPSLTLLEAQWLRLCLPMQGVHVWSLVEELRSHMPEP